jgi:hypothetical protein
MTFDDTRDNTATIEAQLIEADRRENDPQDPEHDPIGDAETEYDIEFDDTPEDDDEDDGQPSEYTEWQDHMGGDDWDQGQYDDFGY